MSPKKIIFVLILGVVVCVQPTRADAKVQRQYIISASLDAIQRRFQKDPAHTAHQSSSFSSSQIKPVSFLSDFSLRSPLLDALSFYRRFNFPGVWFNEAEGPDLTEADLAEIDLAEMEVVDAEIDFDDFALLDSYGERIAEFYLGTHYGYFTGHHIYQISFDGGKSELEFPLKSMATLGARIAVNIPKFKLVSESTGYVGTYDRSGDMYDTDWGADDVLISDTVSDAYLKLLIWDTSLGYMFWRNEYSDSNNNYWDFAVSVLGGYRHEYFKYMIYDVYDTSRTATSATGPALEYRVTYNIPYFGVKFNLAKVGEPWGISVKTCFSPFVRVKDFDDHLLRGKRAFGECRGWAALVSGNFFWNFRDAWTLQSGIDYANIRTAGEQNQIWYKDEGSTPAGYRIDGIDDNIYSNQLYYWARINYKF